jgi:hypothetical protein
LNTTGRDKILDIGAKEVFLNTLNIGSNVSITHSNKIFKIHDWNFTSNVLWNTGSSNNNLSSIQFSTSNNWIGVGGSLGVASQVSCPLINTNQIVSNSNGYIQFFSCNLTTKYQDGSNGVSYSSQYTDH